MTVLLTGAAGFIGYHVAEGLLAAGARVIGVDDLNTYYDVPLKPARLEQLLTHPSLAPALCAAAREAICRRYDPARMLRSYHEVYCESART